MKGIFTTLLIFLTSYSISIAGIDVEEVKEKLGMLQNTENSGREFWFTIPPCSQETAGQNFIKILVTSSVESQVVVEVPQKGFYKTRKTVPNSVIDFSLTPVDAQAYQHNARSDMPAPAKVYKGAGIHITSDYPVTVYVIVKYRFTSDGFFAIPITAFGTKYINMVYQEPNFKLYYDYSGLSSPFTGVTAAYDNTVVTFKMGGGPEGNDAVPLENGTKLKTGQTTTFNMNKGDVWLAGVDDSEQDLSGSLITSDKPISIVSGVHCANFPIGNSWCDYTVSMELPVYTWGENYFVTPEMERTYNGIIRIYASEDNTDVYRDGAFLGTIEKGGGDTRDKAYLETRLWPQFVGAENEDNPPKVAHIGSNKPIAVMYYNTGTQEDKGNVNSDPFMSQIPPVESAVNYSVFSTPNALGEGNPFTQNRINITFPLVNGEIPDDIVFAQLSTTGGALEFQKIKEQFDNDYTMFATKYNGIEYGSKRLTMSTEGSFVIKSDSSKFTLESSGFANYESYAFPIAFSLYDKTKPDSLAPLVTYTQQCNGDIMMEDGLVSDFPENEESRSNLADIYMMTGENYEFDWQAPNNEFIAGKTQTVNWSLTVLDNKKPASALLYSVDRAGNDTIIFIESEPSANIEMISSENAIRNPKLKTYTFQDTIKNPSSLQSLYITKVELSGKNPKFKIDSFEPNSWTPGIPIPPNQEIYINYSYTDEEIEDNQTYTDSVYVGIGVNNGNKITECDFKPLSQVIVKTKYPEYSVLTGNDFGEFGNKPKITKLQDTIRNESTTRPLYISRIELKEGDQGFQISGYNPFDWEITEPIEPENEIIVDIIFNPLDFERTDNNQTLTDSLGIGILEYNTDNELEEVIFNYKSEQKAVILAKDPDTSIDDELILRDYIRISESSIQLLPTITTDGFYELSIYDLVGNQLINIGTENQKSISTSTLQSGTYIITLKSADRLLNRKLRIIK